MALNSQTPKDDDSEIPFWSVKRQKGYKVHRILMVIQIIVALILALVIWFGTQAVLR